MPLNRRSDNSDYLQARGMDPKVFHAMRVECAERNFSYAELIFEMWKAYCEARRGQVAA